MNFSERLSLLVKADGRDYNVIAKAAGIAKGSLTNYMTDRTPKAEELFRLSRVFGKSMEWMLYGDETSEQSPIALRENPAQSLIDDAALQMEELKDKVAALDRTIKRLKK